MNCRQGEHLLEDYLDGQLGAREREAFEAHAPQCARCREALEEGRLARAILRSAFPAEELHASPQFFSQLWQSIESARLQPFSWIGVRDLALRFAMGVAIMLALLIGVNVISGPRLSDNQMAINTYMEAPGASDSFRDVLIGDAGTNRDQLLQQLLQRDRQQNTPVVPPAPPKRTGATK